MAKKTAPPVKAAARSIHVGLNAVNPDDYDGWSGDLVACEFDAKDMAAIAKRAGMTSKLLLTAKATRGAVLAAIRDAAAALRAGDLLFLTYSGHGGQVPDATGEEDDAFDETWCLYDGELIDDELYLELSRCAAGVRILVLSDSCHSGTMVRARPVRAATPAARSKMMPPEIATRTYEAHKAFYDTLQRGESKKFKASAILISGCQDRQTSKDGRRNGAFTERLLQVWDQGRFTGTYSQLHAAIKARMPATQVPNLFTLGSAKTFLSERPFTV